MAHIVDHQVPVGVVDRAAVGDERIELLVVGVSPFDGLGEDGRVCGHPADAISHEPGKGAISEMAACQVVKPRALALLCVEPVELGHGGTSVSSCLPGNTPVVTELLSRHDLTVDDVTGWAVHPGGRRIVEVVAQQLALPDSAVAASYDVLRDVGNCSSSTVLLVLQRVLSTRSMAPGDPLVAMAFGPGLTLYASLLRARGDLSTAR